MERVLFSDNQGSGFICEHGQAPPVRLEAVQIVDQLLQPGSMTDLAGFYKGEVKYIGLDAEYAELQLMTFHLGTGHDLFQREYYAEVLYLSTHRIYITYRHNGGRDYHFKNGQWK